MKTPSQPPLQTNNKPAQQSNALEAEEDLQRWQQQNVLDLEPTFSDLAGNIFFDPLDQH